MSGRPEIRQVRLTARKMTGRRVLRSTACSAQPATARWDDRSGSESRSLPNPIADPHPDHRAQHLSFEIVGKAPTPWPKWTGTQGVLYYANSRVLGRAADFWRQIVPPGTSADICGHEMGHAMLDALRPQLFDAQSLEVAAFHESFGDLSAMFSALQMPAFRQLLLSAPGTAIAHASRVSRMAEHLQGGRVDLGKHGHPAAGLTHPFTFKTHAIVDERGQLVLKRKGVQLRLPLSVGAT
jgi:hypothetical protein